MVSRIWNDKWFLFSKGILDARKQKACIENRVIFMVIVERWHWDYLLLGDSKKTDTLKRLWISDAMNATNYYVSTTRLVLQADPDSPPSWQDLYTALPTLRCCPSHRFGVQADLVSNKESTLVLIRNSLSCTVCENLLSEPYTPEVQEPSMILQLVMKLLFSGDHLWAPCV